MQEHVIVAKRSRIIHQSIFIWLFVALQIGFSVYAILPRLTSNGVAVLIIINTLFSLMTVPAVILFHRYYKYSVGKKFIITYEYLRFMDERTGAVTEIKNTNIEQILFVENANGSRLPWAFHEYFAFIDNKQNKIIITSYFMDISEFWLNTLTRRVNRRKLIREEKIYPIF